MKLLIVFAACLGFVLAGSVSAQLPTREALLHRIDVLDDALLNASSNFTQHGLFYSYKIVRQTMNDVQQLREMTLNVTAKIENIPVLGDISQKLRPIEADLPRLTSDPAPRESMKAGGLYLSVVLGLLNSTTKPSPAELKQQVMAIIVQERLISYFGPNADKDATKNLEALYLELGNVLNDRRLPTMQKLFTLEAATNEAIIKYNKLGHEETSKKFAHELVWFLMRSYDLALLIPIEDETKAEKFISLVPVHYEDYSKLNAMILLDGVEKDPKDHKL